MLTVVNMAPIFGYFFDGGFFPAGGPQVLADAMVEVIESYGGEVRLRTPVRKIIVENGQAVGVELKSGATLRADAIISNADVQRTFLELIGQEHVPSPFVEKIRGLEPSTSVTMVYLGVDYVPDIEPVTQVSTDSGQVGIAVTSKVDPSLAPKGHSAITLLALTPPDRSGEWDRSSPAYRRQKEEAGNKIIALAETVLPGLREHIVYRQDATPATVARYAWTTGGAIYGPALGWRPNAKSPIPGLMLAGAGVFPGAGIEAVVISGIIAADTLCPQQVRNFVQIPVGAKDRRHPRSESEFPVPLSQAR